MRPGEPSRLRAPGRAATLAALADEYIHADGGDIASASLYAALALALDTESIRARCLLAQCYMRGGAALIFPFAPSTTDAAHSRAGALAAVHLLQHGPSAVFADVAAARVYAAACTALGRLRDAQMAMEWTLAHGGTDAAPEAEALPPRDVRAGQLHTQLGTIAMKQARYREAAAHFARARAADPFNWRAWTSLCDMSLAPPALEAFDDERRTKRTPAPRRDDVPPVPAVPPGRRTARALGAARTNTSHVTTRDPKARPPLRRSALAAAGDRARSPPPSPRRAVPWLVALMRALGEAYRLVRLFRARDAVALMLGSDVLAPFRHTAPLQCLLARALHDQSEYAAAEKHFSAARALEPYLLAHMDIYSLVLFQLHREVELAALAHALAAVDPRATAAHIAAGNTWSLQGEHDAAYACFEQAALTSPECAYAYTLAGYEALELDRPARAVRLFRCARRCDRRHWNALAGLGHVYLRRGDAALASEAYAEAFLINSSNAVLLDLLGWALEQAGDTPGALAVYQRAIRMQPRAAMTRLKRAQLLMRTAAALPPHEAAARENAAHAELQRVCTLAPLDAHVHLMLARSYMRRGGGRFARDADDSAPALLPSAHRGEIARHLAAAMHLDPASVRTIGALGDGRTLHRGAGAAGQVAEDAEDSGIDGSAVHMSYAYSWHDASV